MEWSAEEAILLKKIEEIGNKRILISSLLNRTDEQCKNRARKLQRR
jgi:hypothetical protein